MDRMMLKAAIQKIEQERDVHDEKFAGNAVHENCLPRFEKVLTTLKADLENAEQAQSPNAIK